MSGTTIAERMLEPLTECLTPEVAQRIVETQINPAIQDRVNELADKANQGTLTEAETAEYAEYIEWGDVVGIFKARARMILQSRKA